MGARHFVNEAAHSYIMKKLVRLATAKNWKKARVYSLDLVKQTVVYYLN